MAEIEILLPTVQYGNVRITGTPEEFGVELTSPGSIGEMAAVYLNLFTQGFRAGSERDVDYIPTSGNVPESDDVDITAARIIQGELGATTVLDHNGDGPGDVDEVASVTETPWEGEVTAKPKPWEKKAAPKAAPASINW